jgi:hypothetical protein
VGLTELKVFAFRDDLEVSLIDHDFLKVIHHILDQALKERSPLIIEEMFIAGRFRYTHVIELDGTPLGQVFDVSDLVEPEVNGDDVLLILDIDNHSLDSQSGFLHSGVSPKERSARSVTTGLRT